MADINLHFRLDLRVPRVALGLGLACLMAVGVATELASENVTMTTFYPAPSGVYRNLVTTEATNLATSVGHSVIIGKLAGPATADKLQVAGDARFSGIGYANDFKESTKNHSLSKVGCGWTGTKCNCYRDGGENEVVMIMGTRCQEGAISEPTIMHLQSFHDSANKVAISCPATSFPGCDDYRIAAGSKSTR